MGKQQRILMAEDSPTQAERSRLLLEDAGYLVDVVPDGRKGLQRVHEKPPDLIISDVMMPEMDGYTFCREIKTNDQTKRIPFVLLTNRRSPLDIIKGLERGADNFITKPFEDDILLERIHRIFQHVALRKKSSSEAEVSIRVGQRESIVSPDKQQIIELLFSTFEDLSRMNTKLEESQRTVENYTRNLEGRVEERTQALQAEIVEHKRTEHNLAVSEVRYRRLFESAKDGILILDYEKGHIVDVNPYLATMLGFSREELLGKTLWDIGFASDGDVAKFNFIELQQAGYVRYEDLPLETKDHRTFAVEFISNVYLVDQQNVIQCNIRDITERKRLEGQLRQAQRMEAVGQLTGGIAHDFNNLLTVINGYSEMSLEALRVGDPQRDNIAQIKEAGERAAGLTQQLLAFSRKQILEPKVLDLNAVVNNVDKMLTRTIGEDVDFVTTLMPELDRVKADPGQIDQVILNLVVNARDAMPQGGKLTIETANVELDESFAREHAVVVQPGHYVMLAVTDTGCGMDAEIQRHIFEPFFTTKGPGKGTGLGLATAYGIVKQSGGSIWVYSEVGKGTTFKVYLPKVEEKADILPIPVRTASLKGTETILLVEDDAPLRKLTLSILRYSGYHVPAASSREEALQLCSQHQGPIHLMLTDVVMPGMSGQDATARFASIRPDMKVLHMSGYTDDTITRHGILIEGLAFLQKPFTTHSLLRKVREALDAPPRPS